MKLFGKKESRAVKMARESVRAFEKALAIVQKCDSIGDNEIKELAEALEPSPSVGTDSSHFVQGMIDNVNVDYLSYVRKTMSSGQKPCDKNRFVKDEIERRLKLGLEMWEKSLRELEHSS